MRTTFPSHSGRSYVLQGRSFVVSLKSVTKEKEGSQMTGKQLLDELLVLKREHADFDTLDVCVTVVDQKTYDQEHAEPPLDEMTDTIIADGIAYTVVSVTGYDMKSTSPQALGDYLLIRAVLDED
jgi:hypothetical protein